MFFFNQTSLHQRAISWSYCSFWQDGLTLPVSLCFHLLNIYFLPDIYIFYASATKSCKNAHLSFSPA